MSSNTLVLIACLAVAMVLVLGLANMMRGGSASLSQRLMRLRVLLQFIAIVLIMGVVWWRSADGPPPGNSSRKSRLPRGALDAL